MSDDAAVLGPKVHEFRHVIIYLVCLSQVCGFFAVFFLNIK